MTVTILDDEGWAPDQFFTLRLFDVEADEGLQGRDTVCKVTIIDEDRAGHEGRHRRIGVPEVAEVKYAVELDKKDKNRNFGFKCLEYVVKESVGKFQVVIFNKKVQLAGRVQVLSQAASAKGGVNYVAVDEAITLERGDAQRTLHVRILDSDFRGGDLVFYLQLCDPYSYEPLPGQDTRAKITILDDDTKGPEKAPKPEKSLVPLPRPLLSTEEKIEKRNPKRKPSQPTVAALFQQKKGMNQLWKKRNR